MQTIQATLLYEVPLPEVTDRAAAAPIIEYRDRALYNACLDVDGAANLIDGFSHIQGNDTAYHFLRTDHATGAITPLADVLPPPGFKIDSAGWIQSGPNLIVGMTVHEAISDPTRRVWYARAVVPNVAVPRSDGRGLEIDPTLLGGGDPTPAPTPSEPVDYAHIQALIAAEVNRFIGLFGGGSVRGGLQEKVMDGLRDAMLKENRGNPRAAAFQDSLAEFVRDRAFEAATEALRHAGFPPR